MFWNKKTKKIALSAPGPSPWFLRSTRDSIVTPAGKWTWKSVDDRKLVGTTQLVSSAGDTVLLLGFQCYVLLMENSRILIWNELRPDPSRLQPVALAFTILDLSALNAIPIGEISTKSVSAPNRAFMFSGPRIAEFEFNTKIDRGIYPLTAPIEFRSLPEILALAEYAPLKPRISYGENIARAVFAFRFGLNQVEVIPQDWFNNGSYDFGYQWIARVEREQKSGRIVGEGVRLGMFRLDASGTQVEEWLREDGFYHPGSH